MSTQAITVKQIANRLENATSLERIDALQELQTIAKQSPEVVGEHSLKKVLDFLKEQGSSEEYQEALDLIYRLVKCRDKAAAHKNTAIILGDARSVELLLELLEHEDLMVGVMTSQILTEIHANDGPNLESQIQMCPDGMNKLLQRLPDTSREEVRNQAIVLIQQLTANNEEMKKTVVFNEGFEILFNIIRTEGGANDVGVVTQDCLSITNNILNNSETCQRLFFGMGVDWILRLADFFDPLVLESKFASGGNKMDEDQSGGATSWYDQPTRLSCAILALSSLYNSLSVHDKKHQIKIVKSTSIVIPSAAFWIARKGPVQLINAALSLLYRAVHDNPEIAEKLFDEVVKFSPPQVGKNVPFGTESSAPLFSWRPSHEDDRRLISLPALLVERYIFAADTWVVEDGLSLQSKLHFECNVSGDADSFATNCLKVFEKMLTASEATSDILVQYILAPPPPPGADMMSGRPHESMTPLGTLVLNVLVDGCQKVVGSSSQPQFGGMSVTSAYYKDMIASERAANVLALVFMNGSSLAREFATAIRDDHTSLRNASQSKALPLLPILLSTAGRTARIPNGSGYLLLISLLRMLATIVSGCEPAAKQMFEDPANLFVVELATVASESAGIPSIVQVMACFFLGCCFQAYAEPKENEPTNSQEGTMNKSTFLAMIDKRIGLDRLTKLLNKPLQTNKGGNHDAEYASLFFSTGFKTFYKTQVDLIEKGIFSFYTGVTEGHNVDAATKQLIDMQKNRIDELERQIKSSGGTVIASTASVDPEVVKKYEAEVEELKSEIESRRHNEDHLRATLKTLESELRIHSEDNDKLFAENASLQSQLNTQTRHVDESDGKLKELNETVSILKESLQEAKLRLNEVSEVNTSGRTHLIEAQLEAGKRAEAAEKLVHDLRREMAEAKEHHDEELKALRQVIHTESEEKHSLLSRLENKDNEIAALKDGLLRTHAGSEAELKTLQQLIHQESQEKHRLLEELEHRNKELKSFREGQDANHIVGKRAEEAEKLVHDLQHQLAELKHAHDEERKVAAAEDLESWVRMVQTVLQMVHTFGVEVADFENCVALLQSNETKSLDKSKWLEYLLGQCNWSVFSSIKECHSAAGVEGVVAREGTIANLNETFKGIHHKIGALNEEKVKLSKEIADLQHKLSFVNSEFEEFKTMHSHNLKLNESESANKIDELSRQNHDLHLKLNFLVDVEKKLQFDLHEKDHVVEKLQAELMIAKNEIEALSNKLEAANESIASLEKTIELTHTSTGAEIASLKSQLQTAENAVKSLQDQFNAKESSATSETDTLSNKLKISEGIINKLKADLEATRASATTDAAELSNKLSTLTKQIESLSTEKNTAVQNLSTSENNVHSLEHSIKSLHDEVDNLRRSNSSLESTVEHLKNDKSGEVIAELEEEKASLLQKVDLLKKELNLNVEQVRELTRSKQDVETELTMVRANGLDQVEKLTKQHDAEINKLSALFKDNDSNLAKKESEISTLESSIASLEASIAQLKTEHSSVIVKWESEVHRLKDQLHATETDSHNKLSSESTLFIAQMETLKKEKDAIITKLTKEKNDLNDRITVNDSSLNKLVSENSTLLSKHEAALQKVIVLEKELLDVRGSGEDNKTEIEALRTQLTATEGTVQNLIAQLQTALKESSAAIAEKSSMITKLQKEIKMCELATGEWLDEKASMEAKMSEIEVHKAHAVELQKQINALNVVISDLKAKAVHDSKSINDAYNVSKIRERQLEEEIITLQGQAQGLQQEIAKQKLEVQRLQHYTDDLGESLASVNTRAASLEDQLSKNKVIVYNATKDADDLRRELLQKENDVRMLKDSFEAEKIRIEERHKAVANMDPFRAQDHEMKRLAGLCDKLTKDLSVKEQEVIELHNKLLHFEGDVAGKMAALDGLRFDNETLKNENDSMTNKRLADSKLIKEYKKEIDSLHVLLMAEKEELDTLKNQISKDKFKYQSVDQNSELLALVETRLHQVLIWIVDTLDLSSYTERMYSREYAYSCLELVDLIKACVGKVVGKLSADLEDHKTRSADKDRKGMELPRPSSTIALLDSVLVTPAKKSSSLHSSINGQQNVSDMNSGLLTPPHSGGGELTLIKSSTKKYSISPSAKEAARLNAEILREKRKFSSLNEQHSDLLGLLAQQEVELNVFRQALETKCSPKEVDQIENIAQRNVIEMYGVYTNFRQYDNVDEDEADFSIRQQLKAVM